MPSRHALLPSLLDALVILATLAALAASSAALAEPVLQAVGSVDAPPALGWGPWGERTLAVTGVDVRLVNWSLPEVERAPVIFSLPEPPSVVETWGDSTLIQVPGEGGRLLARGVEGPTEWIETPANWHLPNTGFAGETYRVLVEPQVFLLVYSAPGPGAILGLLDFEETIGHADRWAWSGDRVLLSNDDGVHVVTIANPLVPLITTTIEPPVAGWTAEAIGVRDHRAYVDWGDRIVVYDIDGPGTPPQLGEVSDLGRAFVVDASWLVSWDRADEPELVTVYDVTQPDQIAVRGTIALPVATTGCEVVLRGDLVEISHALGLASYRIPAGGGPIVDRGYAWPVLEGWPLATAGGTAWLQGADRRYVVDLASSAVVNVQDRLDNASTASLLVRDGLLLDSRGAGLGVSIESLADPAAPAVLSLLDPTPGLEGIDVAGELLAAADLAGLVLYDLADPAAPQRRGELELAGATTRVLLVGEVAVVTARRELEPDLAHVVDITDRDAPQLVESFALEHPSWPGLSLDAGQLVRRGDRAHILLTGLDGPSEPVAGTATIDLADPAAPQLGYAAGADFWCFDLDADLGAFVAAPDLPVTIGDFHVSFRADTVAVHADLGGVDQLQRLDVWVADRPIETLAAAGNRLLVLGAGRVDVLTLSDDAVIGVPDAAASHAVRAVPNPFNPQTEIVFAMDRAGRVRVEIYDLRGGLVRRLAASLPAGPARLTWRGDDQAGRALPSGTYLLRVTTPSGAASGRCQLVR